MEFVPLVNAFRGERHRVVPADEEKLKGIYNFFEQLRSRPLSHDVNCSVANGLQLSSQSKRYTLPQQLQDWYVPRDIQRSTWFVERPEDDKALMKYVAALHELGISTLFAGHTIALDEVAHVLGSKRARRVRTPRGR